MDPSRQKFRPQSTHALLVVVLLLCLLSGTVLVWRMLLDDEQQRSHQLLQQQADSLARQLETHFSYQTDALQRLALRWDHYHNHRTLWQEDTDRLLHDFANLQAIEWLDSSYQVRWLRPLEGNEKALGFHYQADHPNMPYLHQARETSVPTLSSHFELLQGGHGLAYHIPMYRQVGEARQFDGYLIAVFRVEQLIDSLLRQLPPIHMSLSLSNNQQPIFQRKRPDTIDAPAPIKAAVQLGGNDKFVLESHAYANMLQHTPVPLITLISGVLASLMLCYALWMALLSSQRLHILQNTNRTLQSEVARRQEVEKVLHTSQARLQLVLDMTDYSDDALFILNLDPFEIVYMNRTCWASIGYSAEQLRSLIFICPEDVMPGAGAWLETLRQQATQGESAIYQQHVRARTGKLVPLEISVRPTTRLGSAYLVCVGRNNQQQLKATAQLEKLSQLDGLTGLFNRRYFDAALSAEWRRLQRQHAPLGLLMVDVDFFKRYNDTYGHLLGDDALRKVSHALQQHAGREGERVCRYGGEEFAVLMPGADLPQCHKVAALIHQEIREMNIPHKTESGRLTVSIGIACALPGCKQSPDALVSAADRALYNAKHSGRDRSADADLVT